MELTLNHQKKSFETPPPSVEALLLAEMPGRSGGIAVAVNNLVIPRAEWHTTPLHPGDQVLIITATQGG